jgi:DNA repair protein RecN (Recombination protein N)
MLSHLIIKNYALIQSLEIDFSDKLNVVTGETGAGKSIMLGALGLLLGNRADTKVLLNPDEKCITEGTFEIGSYKLKQTFEHLELDYAPSTTLRREIAPGGKSRAFINDTPVTLDVLRSVGARLMDIHSQHETLELGKRQFQLNLIDTFAQNLTLKSEYETAWKDFKTKEAALQYLTNEAQKLRQESDYVNFQLKELESADFQEKEQETLERDVKVGEHAEEIKGKLAQLTGLLKESDFSVLHALNEARGILNSLTSYSNEYQTLFTRLESVRLELDDITSEMEQASENIEFNPEQVKQALARLDLLYRLMKKHQAGTIKELLEIQEGFARTASKTENLDQSIAQAQKELDAASKLVNQLSKKLSESRKESFQPISKQLIKYLKALGIPQADIEISHQATQPAPTGADLIEINFSANKGIAPRPLAEVASGGEFSRLMFSIKYIMAEKTSLPTLILDEIDSGVSGEIAVSLGKMMKQMATRHQLISISHLPQIAAKGDEHFIVYKDLKSAKATSLIKKLDAEGRVEEIAKMIGGANPSAIARENARELIDS